MLIIYAYQKDSLMQAIPGLEVPKTAIELTGTFRHPPSGYISNRNFRRVSTVLAILVPVGNTDITSGSCAQRHGEFGIVKKRLPRAEKEMTQ